MKLLKKYKFTSKEFVQEVPKLITEDVLKVAPKKNVEEIYKEVS